MEEQKILNGLDIESVQAAIAAIGAQREAVHAPKASRVRWLSGFKFKAFVRNHSFVVDEPTHLASEDEGPSSSEYVLGAYGTCLATGFVFNATTRGIRIRNLEVVLECTHDNYFTFLGLSSEGHPGFKEIRTKLYVQANADEATLREVWDHTVKTSPVGNSLARSVTIKPELELIP